MFAMHHQHKTNSEFLPSLEEHENHTNKAFNDVLSKTEEDQNSKRSGTRDLSDTIKRIDGIAIGHVMEDGDSSCVWVDYPDNPSGSPLIAISTVVVNNEDIGREVALAFERGDPTRPILIGFIHKPQINYDKANVTRAADAAECIDVQLDGERLTFAADKEIVLRSGKASITLTRAGKVLIRGEYLLSRSSGVNRIKGGSVQIN